jgi:hypothetical protein
MQARTLIAGGAEGPRRVTPQAGEKRNVASPKTEREKLLITNSEDLRPTRVRTVGGVMRKSPRMTVMIGASIVRRCVVSVVAW